MTDKETSPGATSITPETANLRPEPEMLPDPFDPERLALKGNPADTIGVRRVLAHVPVRKPNKQEYFRAHPDPAFRIPIAILELKAEREFYAVLPEVAAAMPGETKPAMLTTCVNRQGNLFLWPVPLPSGDGREIAWHATAREAAIRAETTWIRLVSNIGAGCYDIHEATGPISEPVWPDHTMSELLRVAFGNGRLIDSLDHPVLRQLLGKA
jgi:hypothetical protein